MKKQIYKFTKKQKNRLVLTDEPATICVANMNFIEKTRISATGFGMTRPICRAFVVVSPYTQHKVAEKLAGVGKCPYLCTVKIKETVPDETKQQE